MNWFSILCMCPIVFIGSLFTDAFAQVGDEGVQTTQGIGLENAFPKLRFNRPIHLTNVGDERVFVAEQNGIVHVFENDPETSTAKVFLDISDRVCRKGNEEGLIGFAFHPDFKNNGQFFVHYSSSVKDMHGIVARYHVSKDDPTVGDPNSEEVILEQEQPFRNHNGGTIAFDPKDGLLYISFGDGGKANDPLGSGQDLSTLLGAILRIDVDNKDPGLNYAIPKDNSSPALKVLGVKFSLVDCETCGDFRLTERQAKFGLATWVRTASMKSILFATAATTVGIDGKPEFRFARR